MLKLGKKQKKEQKQQLSPEQAFRVLKPYFDKGVDFLFVVNPIYAFKWAANTNQHAITTALMKHEQRAYLRKEREMFDWFKILLPIGTFIFMLVMAFYILTVAVKSGTVNAPNPANGLKI